MGIFRGRRLWWWVVLGFVALATGCGAYSVGGGSSLRVVPTADPTTVVSGGEVRLEAVVVDPGASGATINATIKWKVAEGTLDPESGIGHEVIWTAPTVQKGEKRIVRITVEGETTSGKKLEPQTIDVTVEPEPEPERLTVKVVGSPAVGVGEVLTLTADVSGPNHDKATVKWREMESGKLLSSTEEKEFRWQAPNKPQDDVVIQVTASYGDEQDVKQLRISVTPCSGGSKTAEDQCAIANLVQLQAMNHKKDWDYVLVNSIDVDASDLSSLPNGRFEPITDFRGSFDGQGHTIRGLRIEQPNMDNVGLFGTTTGSSARIVNVTLEDVYIEGRSWVGSLVGLNHGAVIEGVHVINGHIHGRSYVGGLVGENGSEIRFSSNRGSTVKGRDESVGGLVGKNSDGTIEMSFSSGQVSGYKNVGGLVGHMNDGTIEDSYSLSDVESEREYGGPFGGLVGHFESGNIYRSYSAGKVSGSRDTGGFVGQKSFDWQGWTYDSYWDRESSGQDSSADDAEGKSSVEMKQRSTYVDWDFDTVWEIDEGNDYPQLRQNPRPH